MISGTPQQWAQAFGVGLDDLPDTTLIVLRRTIYLEEAATRLRTLLHGCPDDGLEDRLMRIERLMHEVVALLRDLLQRSRRDGD